MKGMTAMSEQPPTSDTLAPATNFFSVGAELLGEVQRIIGHSKVRALRVNLGGRLIKEVPVTPATAIATVALVIAAVVISNLKVEVVKDSSSDLSSGMSSSGGGAA